jgi:hypothetical protein
MGQTVNSQTHLGPLGSFQIIQRLPSPPHIHLPTPSAAASRAPPSLVATEELPALVPPGRCRHHPPSLTYPLHLPSPRRKPPCLEPVPPVGEAAAHPCPPMRPRCWLGLSRVTSPPSNRANINASTAPACKI